MTSGMSDAAEVVDFADLSEEAWAEHVEAQGWGDGLPVVRPTEEAVARFLPFIGARDSQMPPIPPRQVVPTARSLAANAVMAGCRPEYLPAVLAALRATLLPAYNLHGTLATTHPCGQMTLLNGPLRGRLGVNCGTNCMGQGTRANATIGRALQLILTNIGGAKPGLMDRSTHGAPSKISYCFGENEEESPWAPFHVRQGFEAADSVVTVMAAEGPHNINDHASNTGDGIITTIANTMSQSGSNNAYGKGPSFVVIGPEHAQTLHRDRWTIEMIQQALHEKSRVAANRISRENQENFASRDTLPHDGHYYLSPSPAEIYVIVAGGAGKHSAWIPSFGRTAASSVRIDQPEGS